MDGTSERLTATAGLALLVAACAPASPTSIGEQPPNIVIITADDLGYGDRRLLAGSGGLEPGRCRGHVLRIYTHSSE